MPKALTVTARDREVLDYMVAHVAEHGYAPTVREMCDHFGVTSTSTIHDRLGRLMRHGLIERVGPRAIRITDGQVVS